MTRDTRDAPTETDDEHTFETDAVFDPATYLPTVEAALDDERTEREVSFVADRFEPGARLLDAPCGHGRHANRLAARGYDVAGLDRSTALLDRAREDARERGVLGDAGTGASDGDRESVRYREGDLRDLPYGDETVDGVYNLFTSFGFFDEAGNRRQLAEFARVLRPGGRLVMELAHRDGVLYDYRPTAVEHTAVGTVVEERSFDPRTGRNRSERLTVLDPDAGDDPRTGGRPGDGEDRRRVQSATYEVRLYSFTELRSLLRATGFEVEEVYGSVEEAALSLDSTRMAVVAELAG